MNRKFALLIAMSVLAAAALIPAGLASPSKSTSPTVASLRSKLGRILVDGRGRTLYLFEKDKGRKSACYGACAALWPPLIANGKLRAGTGSKASLLGTTKRTDGRRQVTYGGHPLYTYVGDTKKGQTAGEGIDSFGAEWYVLSPAGAKIERAETAAGGAGYPYPGPGYGG